MDDDGSDSSGSTGSSTGSSTDSTSSWSLRNARGVRPPQQREDTHVPPPQRARRSTADFDSRAANLALRKQPSRVVARKASKKIDHASKVPPTAFAKPGGKENSARSNSDAEMKKSARSDATWKPNVEKWQEEVSPRNLTPRHSSKRKTKPLSQSAWNLRPHHRRYDEDEDDQGHDALISAYQNKSPGEQSRSGIRTPQPAEEPDAESPMSSVAIEMNPLVQMANMASSPGPCEMQQQLEKAEPPLTAQTKRIMERAPLLRPLSSIENDPDWEFRYALESTPNLKEEFLILGKLSYPVIFTYVLEFLPGIVSMTIVGHLDSPLTKEYVDGVSLSTMFMNLTGIAFGFGLATAMDTLCSQAYGAGKPLKLGIYLQSGLIVLGITVIPVFLLNWYTAQFLLWMGQPEEVAILAGRFSRMILPGIPFLYAYELFKKLLQAQNVVMPMVFIAVLSNVVNIALGVYLSFYTSWGFDGAAVARTIANIALPISLIPFFMWKPEVVREWWPGWKLAQALQHIHTFLTLGIPGMFMMLLEWWSFEIMAAFVGLLPNSIVAISVHSVLVSVSTMAFNFFLGISVATNIRVGNYVGSNQPEHAKMASNLGMLLSLAVSATLAVIIIASRNYLPMVFINDQMSIALAGHALLFLMPYQMLDAVNSVMQGVFRGTGRNVLGAYINLFAYFAIGLPFGLYLAFPLAYGVEGLWMGLTAGIFGGCIVSVYKIYKTNWEDMTDAARIRTS